MSLISLVVSGGNGVSGASLILFKQIPNCLIPSVSSHSGTTPLRAQPLGAVSAPALSNSQLKKRVACALGLRLSTVSIWCISSTRCIWAKTGVTPRHPIWVPAAWATAGLPSRQKLPVTSIICVLLLDIGLPSREEQKERKSFRLVVISPALFLAGLYNNIAIPSSPTPSSPSLPFLALRLSGSPRCPPFLHMFLL